AINFAFVATNVTLLGMWMGTSTVGWPKSVFGALVGIVFLTAISQTPWWQILFSPVGPEVLVAWVPAIVLGTVFMAITFIVCGKSFARLEWRRDWSPHSLRAELQFSLRSLLFLMALIALIMGGQHIAYSISEYGAPLWVVFTVWDLVNGWL